jgi:hypothetical protein
VSDNSRIESQLDRNLRKWCRADHVVRWLNTNNYRERLVIPDRLLIKFAERVKSMSTPAADHPPDPSTSHLNDHFNSPKIFHLIDNNCETIVPTTCAGTELHTPPPLPAQMSVDEPAATLRLAIDDDNDDIDTESPFNRQSMFKSHESSVTPPLLNGRNSQTLYIDSSLHTPPAYTPLDTVASPYTMLQAAMQHIPSPTTQARITTSHTTLHNHQYYTDCLQCLRAFQRQQQHQNASAYIHHQQRMYMWPSSTAQYAHSCQSQMCYVPPTRCEEITDGVGRVGSGEVTWVNRLG